MIYKIMRNSVSNFPTPIINCNVVCFLNEEDKTNNNPCFWQKFQIDLKHCIGKTKEEIDTIIKQEGDTWYNSDEAKVIFAAIEAGVNITAPAEVV